MRYRTLFDRARMAANLVTGHFRHARHRMTALRQLGVYEGVHLMAVECRCVFWVTVTNEQIDRTPAAKRPPRRRVLPGGPR